MLAFASACVTSIMAGPEHRDFPENRKSYACGGTHAQNVVAIWVLGGASRSKGDPTRCVVQGWSPWQPHHPRRVAMGQPVDGQRGLDAPGAGRGRREGAGVLVEHADIRCKR